MGSGLIVLLEVLAVSGGLVAWAAWELYKLRRDKLDSGKPGNGDLHDRDG
jgi:hypothetical protein